MSLSRNPDFAKLWSGYTIAAMAEHARRESEDHEDRGHRVQRFRCASRET
jgi:hypothetical protein